MVTPEMTFSTTVLAVLGGLAALLWGCVWLLATQDGLVSTRRLRGWLSRSWIAVLALLAAIRQPELRDEAYDDEVIDEEWAIRNTQEEQ